MPFHLVGFSCRGLGILVVLKVINQIRAAALIKGSECRLEMKTQAFSASLKVPHKPTLRPSAAPVPSVSLCFCCCFMGNVE